jgi:fused signal recognition particle receptor
MRIYFFIMFSFFKKKSPAPIEPPLDQTTVSEPALHADDVPQVGIEPFVSTQSPVEPTLALEILTEVSSEPAADDVSEAEALTQAKDEAEAATQPDSATTFAAESDDTPAPTQTKTSWLSRLRSGLSRTGQSIGTLFVGVKVDAALFEELETALIMADTGVEATEQLLTKLRARVKKDRIETAEGVRQALREVLTDHLKVLEKPFEIGRVKTLVVMIAGVNGAGKTTSIGKLAYSLQHQGAKVLLAAGDTFRAAARQQLIEWGTRNNVDVIAQEGADPAAVAFDAVHAGRARAMDVVMVDTAGRLPTQLHLMDELKKIRRVIAKADPTAPHEVLLVVDGNTGQNVLSQIRTFDAAIGLTGLIVTKLDGTAKGGTLAAVAAGSQGLRPIPVYWIGVGERIEDLQPFVAAEFAAALVG